LKVKLVPFGLFRTSVFGLLALTMFLSLGCGKPASEAPDVILLHTGRLRGNVYPMDLQSIAPLQHYPYLAGYVKQVREEAAKSGARVLLVDLGDSLEGSFAAHATDSENVVTLFNALQYDVIALSNLDNAVPSSVLEKLEAIILNPFSNALGEPALPGTFFGSRLEKAGLPIVMMSNFYGDAGDDINPDRFPAWFGPEAKGVKPFRDYDALAKTLGAKKPGQLSLLTWMKFDDAAPQPEKFLEQIRAAGVSGILAHRIYGSNQMDVWSSSGFVNWKPPVSLNILRNNGGFALARMDMKREREGWKVLSHQLLPMTANTAPADQDVVRLIESFAPRISAADKVLLDLKGPVPEEGVFRAYVSALASIPGTEVVLYSKESVRSDWDAGELRASEVFNSLPWTSGIVQLPMTPSQIAEAERLVGLVASHPRDANGETFRVTTSEFFARILVSRLGMNPESIQPTTHSSEFDFFVEALTSFSPRLLEASTPDLKSP
jgi:hypothetical protein